MRRGAAPEQTHPVFAMVERTHVADGVLSFLFCVLAAASATATPAPGGETWKSGCTNHLSVTGGHTQTRHLGHKELGLPAISGAERSNMEAGGYRPSNSSCGGIWHSSTPSRSKHVGTAGVKAARVPPGACSSMASANSGAARTARLPQTHSRVRGNIVVLQTRSRVGSRGRGGGGRGKGGRGGRVLRPKLPA